MDEISIQAGRDDSEVGVEMVLKGLWKVDGEIVVEGECPVSSAYMLMGRANDRYAGKVFLEDMDHLGNG